MNQSNAILQLGVRSYQLLVQVGNLLQPVLLLIFRATWGWQFFNTGMGKLKNHADIVAFFANLGIPLPDLNAWFIGGLECFGGLLMVVGFCSRPIAFLLSCTMTVAYLSVPDERSKVFNVFNNLDDFTSADPFLFLVTSLLVLAFGPGALSIDYLLGKFVFQKQQNTEAAG